MGSHSTRALHEMGNRFCAKLDILSYLKEVHKLLYSL
jgi:hypothetical protein